MSRSDSGYTFLIWARIPIQSHVHLSASRRAEGRDRAHSYHLPLPPPAALEMQTRDKSRVYLTVGPQKCFQEATFGPHTLKNETAILNAGTLQWKHQIPMRGLEIFNRAQQLQARPSEACRRLYSANCL